MVDAKENPALTKPLFVYLRGMKGIPLKELREAGYVPVPVDDLDGFKIVQSLFLGERGDELRDLAVWCLHSSTSSGMKEKFGRLVLDMLAANSKKAV